MQKQPPVSQYRVNQSRRLYVHGPLEFCNLVKSVVKPLEHLVTTPWDQYDPETPHQHVVIYAADFANQSKLQPVARAMTEHASPLAYKIIYATDPLYLRRESLLLAVELGARFTVYGAGKDDQLRQHLKAILFQDTEQAVAAKMAEEIESARSQHDRVGLRKILERVNRLNKNSEDTLRLLVQVNEALDKPRQVEFFLKKMLQNNPQCLWAANTLGRFYIKNRKVAEGIETLEKLSQFHELNSDRCYVLGTAYLNVGEGDKAREAFQKGDDLCDGEDSRFGVGLCKADLLDADKKTAVNMLKDKTFGHEVISFLNMRAIMAMKLNNVEEGFRLYNTAVAGATGDRVCQAKIKFNMGLAYARNHDLGKAKDCLEDSARLGGSDFSRAQEPLSIVQKVMAKGGRDPLLEFEDVGWETVANSESSKS